MYVYACACVSARMCMCEWGAPWGSLENAERRIELFLCCCCFSHCDVTCRSMRKKDKQRQPHCLLLLLLLLL